MIGEKSDLKNHGETQQTLSKIWNRNAIVEVTVIGVKAMSQTDIAFGSHCEHCEAR